MSTTVSSTEPTALLRKEPVTVDMVQYDFENYASLRGSGTQNNKNRLREYRVHFLVNYPKISFHVN